MTVQITKTGMEILKEKEILNIKSFQKNSTRKEIIKYQIKLFKRTYRQT